MLYRRDVQQVCDPTMKGYRDTWVIQGTSLLLKPEQTENRRNSLHNIIIEMSTEAFSTRVDKRKYSLMVRLQLFSCRKTTIHLQVF